MRSIVVTCILTAVMLSGCFKDEPKTDYDEVEGAVHAAFEPFMLDAMDTSEPTQYTPGRHNAGHNMERRAYHNGFDDSGDADALPAGAFYTELAVTDDYAYIARASDSGAYGGFSILNLQKDGDHVDPVLVGAFDALPAFDIEVDGAEEYAFLATQRNSIEQIATAGATFQDPTAVLPRGISVVDIRDKRDPTLIQFLPLPQNGAHTITYHEHVNGNRYLIACTYDINANAVPSSTLPGAPLPGVNPATQRVIVYQILDTGLPFGPQIQLAPINQFQVASTDPDAFIMPHDTAIELHPVTNQTLMYVSYWDKGLRIVDFTQPELPLAELSAWTDFTPSDNNAIHWSRPFPHMIDGMHVTVAQPEIISDPDETGQLTFFDTSDPEAPRKLGHWTLPGELGVQGLDFSPHNFDLWDGKVVVGHYHAGVWVIDASSQQRLDAPRSVGFTMDVEQRTDSPRVSPWFWSAFEHDGLIYATDEGTGLYVYAYTGP